MKEVKEGHYPNNQLRWRSNYLNNKRHGLCEWWDSDGQLNWRYNYLNGKLTGLCEEWYSNGEQWVKDYHLI